MKFKKAIVATLSVLALATAWYLNADRKVTDVEIAAKIVTFDNAADLENSSKLVISGVPLTSENHVIYDDQGFTQETFTITEFKINKVFANKSDTGYKEGDTIKVAEPLYTIDKGIKPGKLRFSVDGYQQMKPNKKYLLILKPDLIHPDMFVILGTNEGKHNIDGTDPNEKDFSDFKEQANLIKNEVIKKYNI